VIQDEIGQEASNNLQTGMVKALEAFKKHNGAAPSRIIFYRDGVGEGQVQGVCVPEIEQIKAALTASQLGDTCKLMYINTCKRVNTRIFAGNPSRFNNPLAGTVIDSTVTDRDTYEFYLVSVAARQGMTTPTRFTVVYDQIGEGPDKIELLTYKLCHTYYNVSGAIKEPSCIRYAHRLAALVGERGDKKNAPPVVHADFE
jgi:aubergine-like protein